MATSTILITDELQRVIIDASRRLKDTHPLMRGIATQLLTQTQLNFRELGRPDQWADLAPSTVKRYKRLGISTDGLLRRSDSLYDSLQIYSDAESAGISAGGGNQSGAYARAQQYGYMQNNLQARPYIPIDKNNNLHKPAAKAIGDVTKAYLRRSFR
ncbi:phage virion morphogenesis protein [Psychrobacter sp. AT9]|uniref:phage virion morphogenesis protein n=1 Tax=Psychrobacter sp. AT9 TaxID=3242893 RepID=UPI0039A782A3